jgi:hypothetical protein
MPTIRPFARRLIGALVLVAAFGSFAAPRPVLAQTPCTDAYEDCLVEASKKKGATRELAYIECFARWVGCVGRDVMKE